MSNEYNREQPSKTTFVDADFEDEMAVPEEALPPLPEAEPLTGGIPKGVTFHL